ncbi:MAG TPA: valine--tRNA ligase [Abditibacteriaceae bacterium]|jgi:valyl-tRNA synthetase
MPQENQLSTQLEMSTAFDPHPVEAKWYPFWNERNLFAPRTDAAENVSRYVITIPPPNVTGVLHLGHALQHSIHDCLIRFHRMRGDVTLCVPGTDHAGIATQIKVEGALREETGQTRHDIGRDEFTRRAYEWKDQYGGTIIDQMQRLGCSYDWSRERFTLDENYVRAVLTTFKKWFDAGHIYRGFRLVNWSPGAQTTVSDLEIEFRDVAGKLTHLRYPVEGTNEFITVATTRPETMLGDTAVAVHPEDARYTHLIGKNVRLPLMDRLIPIVGDAYVDKEFGSGAVKITPAHDPNDYEIGERHGLEKISVIGFDAKMTEAAGSYAGLANLEARKKVVADLDALGLVEKIEDYPHSVGHCARTGTVIEPLLSEQWFVAMKELARPVADAIRINRVRYVPDRFATTSLDWLDNIRDWCISRQLWWGHRIPIYYGPNGEVKCSVEPITEAGWTQDEDVLDTWFSSALWPFAVLGWPDNLETQFYPTSVLITGRDILNLWVSRMVATSLDLVNDIPFHEVFVHPTVQDCFGLRMSKSLGTGIDPMELIETYGADATRFGLLQLATGAQDVRFIDNAEVQLGETEVRRRLRDKKPLNLTWDGKASERYPQMQNARGFANKIWNAARFVLSASTVEIDRTLQPQADDLASRWILARLDSTIETVTAQLQNYDFEGAASALYTFVWGDFCDWFVELSKPGLRAGDANRIALLSHVLDQSLRLLHPFMPFLSEEIWAQLPIERETESLSIAAWPEVSGANHGDVVREFAFVQDVIKAARNLRAESQIKMSQKVPFVLVAQDSARATVEEAQSYVLQLTNAESLTFATEAPDNAISSALPGIELFLPMSGLVDVERETARLSKERDDRLKDLAKVAAKLGNEKFVAKAPPEILQKEQDKRAEIEAALAAIDARLAAFA